MKPTFSFFVQKIIIIVCNICIFAPSLRKRREKSYSSVARLRLSPRRFQDKRIEEAIKRDDKYKQEKNKLFL